MPIPLPLKGGCGGSGRQALRDNNNEQKEKRGGGESKARRRRRRQERGSGGGGGTKETWTRADALPSGSLAMRVCVFVCEWTGNSLCPLMQPVRSASVSVEDRRM